MIEGYKRRLALGYVANTASRLPYRTEYKKKFLEGLAEYGRDLGLEEAFEASPRLFSSEYDNVVKLGESGWQKICDILHEEEEKARTQKPDILAQRIIELAEVIGGNATDIEILLLLLNYQTDSIVEYVIDSLAGAAQNRGYRGYRVLSILNSRTAEMLGISRSQLRRRLTSESLLVQMGMVKVDDQGDFWALSRLKRLVFEPPESERTMQQILFDKVSTAELGWSDFDHVAEARDHIERLATGALRHSGKGVNILIHGPPGTGKTEFCKTLAVRLGADLYTVGEIDQYGSEPDREERLSELRLAERLLAKSQNSILLFDEMEDILSDEYSNWGARREKDIFGELTDGAGSRVFMHRMLERNAVPTIWTSNSADQTQHGILRRMMYVFELRQPPRKIRTRIWGRVLERHGVHATAEDAESLSRDFDVTPGVVDRAVASASLIEGGDISAVREGVKSLSRVLNGPKAPEVEPDIFDPTLVCANRDLIELSDQLEGLDSRKFSIFIEGPPGTGKSLFVRYLAERLGLEVLHKRASDLLSMWVGGSEKNIANAFAEARDQEKFLVFDEAESLLGDRRYAVRSWELTQVNEMLTWMETHPLPFACTTNYMERLDHATMRRFHFKLRFDYLSPEKVVSAFRSFFNLEPPYEVELLTNLAPGDFAVVRRQAELLNQLDDAGALLTMLKEESESKPEQANPLGFSNQRNSG